MRRRLASSAAILSLLSGGGANAFELSMAGLHMHGVGGGGGSCPQGSSYADGCAGSLGGSFQQASFFSGGYANQSYQYRMRGLSGITILQPATYPTRPPWNVAGVDYPPGVPQATLTAGLKDAAQIGSDALVNPSGHANCQFYPSTVGNPSGTPAPNLGPEIYCSNGVNPTAFLIQGYDFGRYNQIANPSSVVNDCVFVVVKGNSWPGAGPVFDSNLFVDGPNCNSSIGAMNTGVAQQFYAVNGNDWSFTFTNNTNYGCGGADNVAAAAFGQEHRYATESTRCALNFPTTALPVSYTVSSGATMNVTAITTGTPLIGQTLTVTGCAQPIQITAWTGAGAIGGTGSGYAINNPAACTFTNAAATGFAVQTAGVAPYDNHFGAFAPDGNKTFQYNAMIHLSGRGWNFSNSGGGYTFDRHFEYWEGIGPYIHGGAAEHGEPYEWGAQTAGATLVHDSFNTCLQTSFVDAGPGEGGESCNYFSAGGEPVHGGTLLFSDGSYFTNDVMITNVNPNFAPYWTTSIGGVAYQDNSYGNITIGPNYIDPTGSPNVYAQAGTPTAVGTTSFTGNINLLNASSLNQWDFVVAESGSYNNTTGILTCNNTFPNSRIGVGTAVTVNDVKDASQNPYPAAGVNTVTLAGSSPSVTIVQTASGLGIPSIGYCLVHVNADYPAYGAQ